MLWDAQHETPQIIITAPPVLLFFTNHPLVDKYDLSSLRRLGVGAAPVSAEMMLKCKARFARRGWYLEVGQGYGMTELSTFCVFRFRVTLTAGFAGGVATHIPPEEMERRPTSIGRIFPNCEMRIVDEEFRDVPVGTSGELWIRGPSVMKYVALYEWLDNLGVLIISLRRGYAKNPKATAETITPDGWLRTGDVAIADKDGFLSITDRVKELIKYKGFQGLYVSTVARAALPDQRPPSCSRRTRGRPQLASRGERLRSDRCVFGAGGH